MSQGHRGGLDRRPSQVGWLRSDRWHAMASRLGPLAYSQLGERGVPSPQPLDDVARWLAAEVDAWWAQDGRPDPWTVIVVSGDDGSLARRVVDIKPACSPALRYIAVDPAMGDGAAPARAAVSANVALEEPESLYPLGDPSSPDDAGRSPGGRGGFDSSHSDDDEPFLARGVGPLVSIMGDLPAVSSMGAGAEGDPSGAVVAISVLGAQAFDLYIGEESSSGNDAADTGPGGLWSEIRLAVSQSVPQAMSDIAVALAPGGAPVELADVEATRGAAVVVHVGAVEWLRRALRAAPPGRVVAVEEWSDTALSLQADSAAECGGYWATPTRSVSLRQLARVRRADSPLPVPVAANLAAVSWSTA